MPQITEQQFITLCNEYFIESGIALEHPYIKDCLLMGHDTIIDELRHLLETEF